MLKSTYKPSANPLPPLLPGWTEHKAPTGHTYWHNASTNVSTYERPSAPVPVAPPVAGMPGAMLPVVASGIPAPMGMGPGAGGVPNLADPRVANLFMQTYNPQFQAHAAAEAARREADRRARLNRPKPQPIDKPRRKVAIPGCEPWLLVYTKYGRRFVYNPVKNASYWRIPEKIMKGVLELDVQGVKEKAETIEIDSKDNKKKDAEQPEPLNEQPPVRAAAAEDSSSEYEEIEVTDSESEDGEGGHQVKRLRMLDEPGENGQVEFTEAHFAAQLAAMQGFDLEGDTGEGDMQEEDPLSQEDAQKLFHDLLDDKGINPYSSWDKVLEEGKLVDDSRYTCLTTTKARHTAFDDWSRVRIQALKEAREKEAKKDPRLPYLELLAEKATTKLYWPEFKRKYRKEEVMRNSRLADKDREKMYRDYVARLKLPLATQQKDLAALLKAQPIKVLNSHVNLSNLPPPIITDMRYVSMDPKIRDPLIEAFLANLPEPPQTELADEEDDEDKVKVRADRRRREESLRQHEAAMAEKKRKEEAILRRERANLMEGKRELDAAMYVGKAGLLSQLREEGRQPQQQQAESAIAEAEAESDNSDSS